MINEIHLPRGTTAEFGVKIKYEDGTDYPYSEGDTLRFGVKLDVNDAECAIEKTAEYDSESGEYVIALEPSDTSELDFDRYIYDIGLETSAGDYYMVVPAAWFYVDSSVTEVSA